MTPAPLINGDGTPEPVWRDWLAAQHFTPLVLASLVTVGSRLVVAPHPDDEILACGALLAACVRNSIEVLVIALTDGDATRLRAQPHVEVIKAWAPEAWPEQTFELIVLSEFSFYLTLPALETLATTVLATLAPSGTVVACHWRHPVPFSEVGGDEAHEHLAKCLQLPSLCHVLEPDLRLDVWSAAPVSRGRKALFDLAIAWN